MIVGWNIFPLMAAVVVLLSALGALLALRSKLRLNRRFQQALITILHCQLHLIGGIAIGLEELSCQLI